MHRDVEAWAARHGLDPVALHELRELLAEGRSSLTMVVEGEPSPPTASTPEPTSRYDDLGLLGSGGMGEVRRVRDRDLGRILAMKVVRPELMRQAQAVERFVEEAEVTAQLQHPGIVPVHEKGRLADGRLYFTMREVRGRTLGKAIALFHRGGEGAMSFRRLVDAFLRVCEAVAYAHAQGVVHRDLKPDNVMLGSHGEVLVLDWGIAKLLGRAERAEPDPDAIRTRRSFDPASSTRAGSVAGTPAYMPPEQARGEVASIDARSDVYALGAMLYELLGGDAPYGGADARAVLAAVISGPPRPLPQVTRAPLPAELVEACERAMARDPADRFAHAGELAVHVGDWLEGARRRDQALGTVARALAREPEAASRKEEAARMRREAASILAEVRPYEAAERKAPAWALEDRAGVLERAAERIELERRQMLHGALQVAPDLPEAHAALAATFRADHADAESAREERTAARAEALLRHHLDALPSAHPLRGQCAAYLDGAGALTLVTDPPGAEVTLLRYVEHQRRLVPVHERSLGHTPLRAVGLAMGSYLCRIRHPDRAEVSYPVRIRRQEHWDGCAPGTSEPHPIRLPRPGEVPPDACYVPAGSFLAGDVEAVETVPRQRLWCDGFFVERHPVTNRRYVAFLDDLVANGHEAEAMRLVPREQAGTFGDGGEPLYFRDAAGRFVLGADAHGDAWDPDWPVMMVHWGCAVAHAAWKAARTGQGWRLPGELEREKAARGVDGRAWPWGDAFDPSWCSMLESHVGRPLPVPVQAFPVDESVYGVRGTAGNMRDWCAEPFEVEGPPTPGGRVLQPALPGAVSLEPSPRRVNRGGSWNAVFRATRCSHRFGNVPVSRMAYIGIRLALSFG